MKGTQQDAELQEIDRRLVATERDKQVWTYVRSCVVLCNYVIPEACQGGSVAKWLACWTQVQKARVQIAAATLSVIVLRKLFTPIVPLFTKQQNW